MRKAFEIIHTVCLMAVLVIVFEVIISILLKLPVTAYEVVIIATASVISVLTDPPANA